jgi:hypothetical protein
VSETVKVISASNPNPWEHGITFYDMVFDRGGENFSCSWGTKGGEPQPGEEVTGEFSQKGDGSWKFSKGSKDKPQGGSTGSTESFKGGKSDDVQRQIIRQHSQSAAIAYQALLDEKPNLAGLKFLIDWFDADVLGQAAKQTQGSAAPAKEGAPPPASASPGSVSQPADEHQWFCKLLETAGLSFGPASKLATFILEKLSPEQIKKADNGLTDLDTMAKTLGQLESVFRQTTGEVLVDDNSDDDIPF